MYPFDKQKILEEVPAQPEKNEKNESNVIQTWTVPFVHILYDVQNKKKFTIKKRKDNQNIFWEVYKQKTLEKKEN